MRELKLVELQSISGGYNNNGYTFSFIIENAAICAIPGFMVGLLTGSGDGVICLTMLGGFLGASYATAMMFSTAIDNYAFPQTPSPSVAVIEP